LGLPSATVRGNSDAEAVAEEGVARARAVRLAELLALEAVGRAEADRAKAADDGLAARLEAARRDRDTAASARTGSAVYAVAGHVHERGHGGGQLPGEDR
jgi:hypothetical protein